MAGQLASVKRVTGQDAKAGLSSPNVASLGRDLVKTQSQSAATSLVRLHVSSSCGQDGGADFGRSWRVGGSAVVSRGSGRWGSLAGAVRKRVPVRPRGLKLPVCKCGLHGNQSRGIE